VKFDQLKPEVSVLCYKAIELMRFFLPLLLAGFIVGQDVDPTQVNLTVRGPSGTGCPMNDSEIAISPDKKVKWPLC
jgi:hypothetical protein